MAFYEFPAVLTPDAEDGVIYVNFPHLPGCHTYGTDLQDAYDMGSEALSLMVCSMEDDGEPIPLPGKAEDIPLKEGQTVCLFSVETSEFEWHYETPAERAKRLEGEEMLEQERSVKVLIRKEKGGV